MQKPNIPPLFQTISKAESPVSFLETKCSPGPIRVILGTAHTTIVVPTIGKFAALRQTLTCVETASDTLSEKPHMLPCHTLQSSDRVFRTLWGNARGHFSPGSTTIRQSPGTRRVTTSLTMRWEHTCICLFFPGHCGGTKCLVNPTATFNSRS